MVIQPASGITLPATVAFSHEDTRGQPPQLFGVVLRAAPAKLPTFVGEDLGNDGYGAAARRSGRQSRARYACGRVKAPLIPLAGGKSAIEKKRATIVAPCAFGRSAAVWLRFCRSAPPGLRPACARSVAGQDSLASLPQPRSVSTPTE